MTSVFGGPAASRKPATYRTSIHFIRGISTVNHQELETGVLDSGATIISMGRLIRDASKKGDKQGLDSVFAQP